MSDPIPAPNAGQNVEGVVPPREGDAQQRVDELVRTWESSPLTDPVTAEDVGSERIAQRPDF